MNLLGDEINNYKWVISDIEATGEQGMVLMDLFRKNEYKPLLISSNELLEIAQNIPQFIWGVFLALPQNSVIPEHLFAENADPEKPPHEDAIFEFRIIDGEFYECFFKHERWIQEYGELILK